MKIAVTGSSGLIGRTLISQLIVAGHDVVAIDIKDPELPADISNPELLDALTGDCAGIIHLAAVSRVAEAEKYPQRTWERNVDGTTNVFASALKHQHKPWIIHASSREVYGTQPQIAITEDTAINPLNVYGRSKAACEYMAHCARDAGANVAILRFANVYGDVFDYPDRVIPAFTRAAASGSDLRIDDASTCMDFTHVNDVSKGIVAVTELLNAGETNLPPIHFATGQGTTLGTLARLAVNASPHQCEVNEVSARASSVGCFIGDPARAKEILGWQHQTTLESGIKTMVGAFKSLLSEQENQSIKTKNSPVN